MTWRIEYLTAPALILVPLAWGDWRYSAASACLWAAFFVGVWSESRTRGR